MGKQVSIAQARQNLPALVHEVEKTGPLQLTRRGLPVAVLLSQKEFESLSLQGGRRRSLWEAVCHFRETADLTSDPVTGEEFAGLRQDSVPRDFTWLE